MAISFPIADPSFDERAMAAVLALGEAITRTVRVARMLTDHGRRVDLDGLDRGVGLLCAKSLDLPPELGRAMRPRLVTLLQEIDAMTLSLRWHGTAG